MIIIIIIIIIIKINSEHCKINKKTQTAKSKPKIISAAQIKPTRIKKLHSIINSYATLQAGYLHSAYAL